MHHMHAAICGHAYVYHVANYDDAKWLHSEPNSILNFCVKSGRLSQIYWVQLIGKFNFIKHPINLCYV